MAAKSADPVRMSSSEGIDAFIWAHLDRSYVLMSKGMDGHRFENFASAITALVKRGQKLEEQDKIALRATIDSGEPCRS